MKKREIIQALEAAGFILVKSQGGRSRKGKHLKFKHPDGRWTSISHGLKEAGPDMVKEIEQQAGIKLKEER